MNQNQDQFIGTSMDYNGQKIKNYLPKIKQTIMTSLKNHQHNAIRSNRKLQFYSIFKVPLRRKFLFLFSPFSRSNPFNEYVIAKLAIN